jgi:hypothetical protein
MARRSRSRRHSRKHRGGSTQGAPNPSSYSSAASYQEAVNGSANSQYSRVFDQAGNSSQSNAIVGIQGQRAGKRRRHSKRGGFLGQVINQAIVPFGILGMQQTYRRKRGGRKSRRTRRH